MMEVIQLFKPKFRTKQIVKEIEECCEKGWTGLGYKTEKFETAFKDYTLFDNAHFLSSATAGLHLALKVFKREENWDDGDEIITTPLTFISTNHSILYENLTPVFADVDESLCLDPESVIKNITPKTKAVIFVGMGGNMGEYNKIVDICRQHDIKLIFDAAHCAGTKATRVFHGVAAAETQVGWDADVTVFSFQAVKNLPTADSGMICFKEKTHDELVRKLSWLGIDKDTFSRTSSKGNYKWDYDVIDLGFKSHGNSIMASMGLVGLQYLEEDNSRRREISKTYDEKLNSIKQVKLIPHKNCTSSRHLYQIRVPNRDKVMEYLNSHNVFPGVHYKDNTQYSLYSYAKGKCPNAHNISKEIISLPLYPDMTIQNVDRVVDLITNFFEER